MNNTQITVKDKLRNIIHNSYMIDLSGEQRALLLEELDSVLNDSVVTHKSFILKNLITKEKEVKPKHFRYTISFEIHSSAEYIQDGPEDVIKKPSDEFFFDRLYNDLCNYFDNEGNRE